MDNPYYDWSPLAFRPTLRWPHNANVALGVLITLEHLAWYPPADSTIASLIGSPVGGYPSIPEPHHLSQWEYGNRVGVFRVMDVLERNGIAPTVAMDVSVAEHAPYLVRYLRDRGAEFVGHGLSSEQLITEAMPEQQEARLIQDTLTRLTELTGGPVRGWHGVEYWESSRTVRLLAAAGVDYVLDWPNDEQPHRMKVPVGRMTNLPVALELDDVLAVTQHHITASALRAVMTDSFDRLYLDGQTTGRLLMLNVHPWVTGHPYRIKHFAAAIDHMCARPAVWKATGGQIVDRYREAVGED